MYTNRCNPNMKHAEPTFSDTGEVVVASLDNLLASSSPLVRVMLQHDGLVCLGAAEQVSGLLSKGWKKKGLEKERLTSSFDLPLSGFVPQVGKAEDSIVILILSRPVTDYFQNTCA